MNNSQRDARRSQQRAGSGSSSANAQQPDRQQSQQGREPQQGQQSQQGQPQQRDRQAQQGQQAQGQQAQQGQQSGQNVYGEGNYQATRDYNARTKAFIESGRVDEAAREAAPDSEAEARDMAAAEAEGKRHAKEEDPEITMPESEVGPEDTGTPRPGKED
jgi:hypothetical protein